jgi:hypothetical protein
MWTSDSAVYALALRGRPIAEGAFSAVRRNAQTTQDKTNLALMNTYMRVEISMAVFRVSVLRIPRL